MAGVNIPVCPGGGGQGVILDGAVMFEIWAALSGWGESDSFHRSILSRQLLFWKLHVTAGLMLKVFVRDRTVRTFPNFSDSCRLLQRSMGLLLLILHGSLIAVMDMMMSMEICCKL
jgi:hypothetical protein